MNTFTALQNNTMLALDTIRAHKMRTFLTMLGVIMGTGTIIGVGAILTGLDGAVTNVIRSMGPDAIIVSRTHPSFDPDNLTPEERARKQLTYADARALRAECTACFRVSATIWKMQPVLMTKYKGNAIYQTQLSGVEETFAGTGQIELNEGRFFTQLEDLHHEPVAVIGADVQKRLFGQESPLGKEINVDGKPLRVIGTMFPPATNLLGSPDNRVIVPFFSVRKTYPNIHDVSFVVTPVEGHVAQAMDEIRTILRIQRRVRPSDPDNFELSTAAQMVEQFRQITAMTVLVMVVLSSIGLLVGGIGVMNIMLVSVTERTREIGIRKAIGARRVDIVVQFLLEAAVLTGLGGVIGLGLGWMIAGMIKLIFTSLPTAVPAWAAISGIVVSVGVGLFFGIWPASKAAKLDPVTALRYE